MRPIPCDESRGNMEEQKIIKTLEEDDEFEDFPVNNKWSNLQDPQVNPNNLWEEDWDDDHEDEFTQKLRQELLKNKASTN